MKKIILPLIFCLVLPLVTACKGEKAQNKPHEESKKEKKSSIQEFNEEMENSRWGELFKEV